LAAAVGLRVGGLGSVLDSLYSGAGARAGATRWQGLGSFELEELTIGELHAGLMQGRWTASKLVELYNDRIQSLDQSGPALHAMIELNPDAGAIAAELDAELKAGHVRGALHGVPILIKDNIDTADRMHTSAGSLALAESIAPADAYLVSRLRDAGAVILGKANLSEWSSFRSTHPSSGWSARGGQVKSPYALDRSPAGSSSGTAAAIAASFAAAGVGTETDGSIVCPASACSLVGIKPTVGLISRSGLIPISRSQDTAGPMARTVTDAAILLGAMVGVDRADSATLASDGKAHTDYTRFLKRDGLRGARIGVARATFFGYSAAEDAHHAIETMRGAGATVIVPTDIPHVDQYGDTEHLVLMYEFKAGIEAYLSKLSPSVPYRTLRDLIAFNEENAEIELKYFGQEIFEAASALGPLTEPEYLEAVAHNRRLSREEGIDAVMDEYNLDALVAPTMAPSWPIDLINGDPVFGTSSTPAAVAGYPSISLPIGYEYGLPAGMSFIGRPWSEPILIRLAYALEQARRVRHAPYYLDTADMDAPS
jgi:amidase